MKKRLDKLRKERNHIAHEALLVTIGSNPNTNILREKAEVFSSLENELTECLKLVTDELSRLKVKGELSRLG